MSQKEAFNPIVNVNTKVIILGTLPGEASLAKGQYYANPTNKFWQLLGDVMNERVPLDYQEKINWLLKMGVGLWDVLDRADRIGSLDSNITQEVPNDFRAFFKTHPNIQHVGFNGKKAFKLFQKYGWAPPTVQLHLLPSSSSANARIGYTQKREAWSVMAIALGR